MTGIKLQSTSRLPPARVTGLRCGAEPAFASGDVDPCAVVMLLVGHVENPNAFGGNIALYHAIMVGRRWTFGVGLTKLCRGLHLKGVKPPVVDLKRIINQLQCMAFVIGHLIEVVCP